MFQHVPFASNLGASTILWWFKQPALHWLTWDTKIKWCLVNFIGTNAGTKHWFSDGTRASSKCLCCLIKFQKFKNIPLLRELEIKWISCNLPYFCMEIWFKEGRTNKFLCEFQYLGRKNIPDMSSFCMWKHIANNHLPQSHHKNEKMLLRPLQAQVLNERARSLQREINREVGVSVFGKQRPYGLYFLIWPLTPARTKHAAFI